MERLRVLEDPVPTPAAVAGALHELHDAVRDNGGLTDLYLQAGSPDASETANAELRRLADQLVALTG